MSRPGGSILMGSSGLFIDGKPMAAAGDAAGCAGNEARNLHLRSYFLPESMPLMRVGELGTFPRWRIST